MTDNEMKEIRAAAVKKLNVAIGFNQEVDLSNLLQAVADAITAAICQYDQSR